jgi:hypothetical protein
MDVDWDKEGGAMDTLLKLTDEEIDRYAPYHTWSEFTEGYDDYVLGHRAREPLNHDSVASQAYDRGAECAMRRQRKRDIGK